jgi:tetratricopeptide (TPR) repeat protein
MLGDVDTAEKFLMSALAASPTNLDAFERLERKYEAMPDKRKLLELYGKVGANPPKPAVALAGKAMNALVPLTAKTPLGDEACKGLTGLGNASSSLLEALDAHCLKTGRAKLACQLIEHALENANLPENTALERRRRLVELYINEGERPDKALAHVEVLLLRDINDAVARNATKRLIAIRSLADRVSALLADVRRQGRQLSSWPPPPRGNE